MANKREGNFIINNYDKDTGMPFSTRIIESFPDGELITDDWVDKKILFINKPSQGGGYSVRSYDIGQSKTLVVDNIEAIRNLSKSNILLFRLGIYTNIRTEGYYEPNDGGGFEYLYDRNSTDADEGFLFIKPDLLTTGRFRPNIKGEINVKIAGAKGDDSQVLYDTDYYTDNESSPARILKQTIDGIGINKIIVYLRNNGGGAMFIPNGSYRTYAYLERIDFPCIIRGAGDTSSIKNCDDSFTDRNGYGIFHISPPNVSEITFKDLKVDGNAHIRLKPTNELRLFNFHVMGKPQLRLDNVTSINAAIDCLCTRYSRPDTLLAGEYVFTKVTNSHFENAFRNTISLVSGNNIDFTNTNILGGGFIHGGTNPRYCLDIEPTSGNPSQHVLNIKFTSCTFANSINAVIGGTWGQAVFDNCTIDASYKHPQNVGNIGYPWALALSSIGDWKLNNCRVIGNKEDKFTGCYHYNAYDSISNFSENGWLRIHGTEFEYCGFSGNGRRLEIIDTVFKNSLKSVSFRKGTASPQGDITLRNLKLINIFENDNASGTQSSFSIANAHLGNVDIDVLQIIIDKVLLEKQFLSSDFIRTAYYGFSGGNGLANCATNGFRVVVKNIHCEGFYKRISDLAGWETTASRDWQSPNLPPADATASDRILGGKNTVVYSNCTMWGNFP